MGRRTRTKQRRRMLLVVGVLATLAAAAGGAYLLRQHQINERALDAREAGVKALEAGDWQGALDGLGTYLKRFADRGATAQECLLYARARRNVRSDGNRHLVEASAWLRRALDRDPSLSEARTELLDLEFSSGLATESLEIVETMLPTAPDDLKLLRIKRTVLESLRRFPQALETALHIGTLPKNDLDDAFTTLRLLAACEKPSAEIDDWVDRSVASHRDDPRFELLRAAVLTLRNDGARARAKLDEVVAACPTSGDPAFVSYLLEQYDATGRYADALGILRRLDRAADPSLLVERLRRMWFAGLVGDIVSAPANWDVPSKSSDPEVLAIRLLALRAAGRRAEADALLAALREFQDPVGRAWTAAVTIDTADSKSLTEAVVALQSATTIVPKSAVLRQGLGDACAAMGETDLALDAWKEAARRAPSWAAPFRRAAEALLASGRPQVAMQAARQAVDRAPNDPASLSVLIRASSAASPRLSEQQRNTLLAAMQALRKSVSGRSDDLLPYEVSLLLQVNRVAAEDVIQETLHLDPPPSETTLLRLARLAASANLAAEQALLDRCERAHGLTPGVALYRSLDAGRRSGAAEGSRLLETLASRAGAPPRDLDWDTARALCRDALKADDAGSAWIALAETHPDVLGAQLGAIGSEAAWSDRDAMARIIQRVEAFTGDSATTWRMARARWLMSAPSPEQSDIAEASALLSVVLRLAPGQTAARLMNARALEQLGNVGAAQDQLRIAERLTPADTSIALEIARLMQSQGDLEGARRQVDRAVHSKDLEPSQVERAAWLLAATGDRRGGAELLEPIAARSDATHDGILMLAQMYASLGRHDRAIELCERILDDPDPAVASYAASLYASQGRTEDAAKALARLDGMQLPAGEREVLRARFAAQWNPAQATALFATAANAAPGRADTWMSYLGYSIVTGDTASVLAILGDPRAAAAAEPVRYLAGIRAACDSAMADPRLRPLLLAATQDTAGRPALAEAIAITARDWADPAKRAGAAVAVRRLAESNLRVEYLQILAAELSADAGELASACEIAKRAMGQFPNSGPVAWQTAELLARSDRWSDALDAGLAWNERSPESDLRPDTFVARAMLRLGRAADAVAALEPHAAACLADPERHQESLLVYLLALVRSDRVPKAAEILDGLVKASTDWRTRPFTVLPFHLGDSVHAAAWIDLCAKNVPDSDVAARLALGRAALAGWNEFRSPALLERAKTTLDAVAAAPDASADALFASAALYHQSGDLAAAELGYRRVLARSEGHVSARNNLAMVLANSGKWQQAVDEARKVVAAAPRVAPYLDTLGYALRKGGDLTRSAEALRSAVEIEPGNPEWRVSLAEVLAESGKIDDAVAELGVVNELVTLGARLGRDTQARLDRLRQKR